MEKTIKQQLYSKEIKFLDDLIDKKIKTIKNLKPTTGFMIHEKHIQARKPGIYGYIGGSVPGHGGDVQWVIQNKHEIGVYRNDELILQ